MLEAGQAQAILDTQSNFRAAKKQAIRTQMRKTYPGKAPKLQLNRFASHKYTSRKLRDTAERQRYRRLKDVAHPCEAHPQYPVLRAYHEIESRSKQKDFKEHDNAVNSSHKAYAAWRHIHGEAENKLYGLTQHAAPTGRKGRTSRLGGA